MKLSFALTTVAIAATMMSGMILIIGPAGAAGPGHTHVERAPKVDWATLPVGVATSIAALPPDEQAKITAIETKLKSDALAARSSSSKPAAASQIRALDQQAGADVMAVLTQDQITAIEADAPVIILLKTTIGFRPDALDQLTLTTDQLDKLKDLASDHDTKQQAIDDEAKAKTEELKTATRTQASALFTPEQNALLTEKHGGRPFGAHVRSPKVTR